MTNLDPDQPGGGEHGLGWVTLADGITRDPAWLSRHVPRLSTAWQPTPQPSGSCWPS